MFSRYGSILEPCDQLFNLLSTLIFSNIVAVVIGMEATGRKTTLMVRGNVNVCPIMDLYM